MFCTEASSFSVRLGSRRPAFDSPNVLAPAQALAQLGELAIIVAAEGKEGLQRGEGAAAERLLQSGELGEGDADLLAVEACVARGFLDHRLFGLRDQPRQQLPIAADAGRGFGA